MRRWDLRASLGGLPRKNVAFLQKATKIWSEIPQTAKAFCAFSSLFAQKKFDSAQDDRLTDDFVLFGCFVLFSFLLFQNHRTHGG